MKKWLVLLISIILAALSPIFISGDVTAFAAEENVDIETRINEEIDKALDDLIGKSEEDIFKSIENDGKYKFGDSLRDVIMKILKGEVNGFDSFVELLFSAIKKNLFGALSGLLTIIILAMFYGLSKNLNSGFMKESTGQIIYYVVYGSIITVLAVMINSAVMSTKTVIGAVTGLVEGSFPVLVTLMTAIGGTSGASVFQPAALFFCKVLVGAVNTVVLPLFFSSVVFSIIGNLSSNIKLGKLTNTLRTAANWFLGAIFGLFTAVISAQGLVGASIDSVSVRSAKFALSSYVPILGGYLSEGFDIVLAGAVLVKNAFGMSAMIMLFLILLAPVMKVLMLSLALKVVSGVIEPMTDERLSGLLYSTSKSLSVLVAVMLGLGFVVFVMLLLVISSFNVGLA